jgi:hypothetical protein
MAPLDFGSIDLGQITGYPREISTASEGLCPKHFRLLVHTIIYHHLLCAELFFISL